MLAFDKETVMMVWEFTSQLLGQDMLNYRPLQTQIKDKGKIMY